MTLAPSKYVEAASVETMAAKQRVLKLGIAGQLESVGDAS
jgi:hypothetical protein